MKYLVVIFKAIIRFFKKNIFSIIGLIFLLFFASATFTTLNNTTNNLSKSYSKIVKEGNLHDFVINERYIIGEGANYLVKDEDGNIIDIKKVQSKQIDNNSNSQIIEEFYRWIDNPENISKNNTKIDEYSKKSSIGDFVTIEPDAPTWKDGNKTLLDSYNEWVLNGRDTSDPNYLMFYNGNESILSKDRIDLKPYSTEEKKIEAIKSRIANNKTRLFNLTYKFLQDNFIRTAEGVGAQIRPFESANLTTNQQGLFYKIINQSYDETIDKVVLYDGNDFTSSEQYPFSGDLFAYAEQVTSSNPTTPKDVLREQGVHFVDLLSKARWSDTKYQKSYISYSKYLKVNPNIDPYFDNKFNSESKLAHNNFINIIKNGYFNDKTYQVIVNDTSGSAPLTAVITNKRSYEAIVTPDFLNKNSKECISYNEWKNKINSPEEEFNKWFANLDKKYKVQIDNDEYVILGAGLSPDFMYPIVSFSRPLPNLNNEAIIYTNNIGYQKILDSFRNVETENVLLGKFNNGIDPIVGIEKINEIASNYMAFPSNLKAAYLADDLENTFTPASMRITFIPKIILGIDLVSGLILTFILISVLIASFILIKRFIEKNKSDLGILLANGYTKSSIILPLSIVFVGFILIGTIIGYSSGFGLQIIAMDLLSNFWTIPFNLSSFNAVPFILFIFCIASFFGLAVWGIAFYIIKGDATLLIDSQSANRINKFAYLMKKIFYDKNPISQLRYSLAFSSLFKLFTLSIMSGLVMTVMTFSMSSSNKFQESQFKTFNARQYNYAIDLYTPTLQGGQYFTVPYDKIGMSLYGLNGWDNPNNANYNLGQYINEVGPLEGTYDYNNEHLIDKDQLTDRGYSNLKDNEVARDMLTKYGTFQLPSSKDGIGNFTPTNDLMYLQALVQSKLLMNVLIKPIIGPSVKPWDIAVKLMPSNQRKYCEEANKKILSMMSNDSESTFIDSSNKVRTFKDEIVKYIDTSQTNLTEDDYETDSEVFINESYNPNRPTIFPNVKYWKLDLDNITNHNGFDPKLNTNYVLLMLTAFTYPKYAENNYLMTYNKIPMMPSDATYSYATFKLLSSNELLPEQKIIGISKHNEKFLNLRNDKGEDLESILLSSNIQDGIVPIIINKSASKKLNISKNDTFSIDVTNTVDRRTRNNDLFDLYKTPIGKRIDNNISEYKDIIIDTNNIKDSEDHIRSKYTFKVIDILDTYEGMEMYTSQAIVNKITGMEIFDTSREINEFTNNLIGDNGIPYNGVFTNNATPFQVQNGIMFYADSGLYIANDQTIAGLKDLFGDNRPTFIQKKNREKAASVTGYTGDFNDFESFINNIANTFGKSAYTTLASNVTPTAALHDSFTIMNNTIYTIQLFAVSIIMIVSLIIISLITFILINDSIKISSLLKAMGLSDTKNALSLLLIYIPIIILATLISIPITLFFTNFYVDAIFNFSGILLNIPILWWQVVLSGGIILLVFICAFSSILYQLKKKNLANEIK